MQLLRASRRQRLDAFLTMGCVLVAMLIVLVGWVLLGNVVGILGRFQQQIFLFIFGALLAYIILPVVNLLQRLLRRRSMAIAGSYLLLFLGFGLFGILLLNPFISQARSLVENLHNPAAGSLQSLNAVRLETHSIDTALTQQQQALQSGTPPSPATVQHTLAKVNALQQHIAGLQSDTLLQGQLRVPPSSVTPIKTLVDQLAASYGRAAAGSLTSGSVKRAVSEAMQAAAAADSSYRDVLGTPILVLDMQTWADKHGIKVNLHDKFGNALAQLDKQLATIVNNALGIALQAGNLLLNTVLILLISIYFVSDGARFVRWSISLAPKRAQPRTAFLVHRLDQILGTYLRTQVLLAVLAGGLAAAGAVVIGVPYAIVIFFSCFFLSLIPVIGPVILPIPPTLIALIFTSMPKPLIFLLWLLVAEQLATNVIGPRVQGHSVGIHPLEAMAAALLGFPIAGFVGSFFAVPIVSFLHVVVREFRHSASHEEISRALAGADGLEPAAAPAGSAAYPLTDPPPS
jgi:predicted PurR-regulated permease PerM